MTDDTDAPLPFRLRKIGHVVLNVTDLEAAVRFYTALLGLEVSDRYPPSMVPGGWCSSGATPTTTASRSWAGRGAARPAA